MISYIQLCHIITHYYYGFSFPINASLHDGAAFKHELIFKRSKNCLFMFNNHGLLTYLELTNKQVRMWNLQ